MKSSAPVVLAWNTFILLFSIQIASKRTWHLWDIWVWIKISSVSGRFLEDSLQNFFVETVFQLVLLNINLTLSEISDEEVLKNVNIVKSFCYLIKKLKQTSETSNSTKLHLNQRQKLLQKHSYTCHYTHISGINKQSPQCGH